LTDDNINNNDDKNDMTVNRLSYQ